jgi:aconitate hydratase
MAMYVFSGIDESFYRRAIEKGGGIIIAGENYGQGSSREHAALAPLHLKIKAVVAKSFARIHRKNLVNFGIIPLLFARAADYNVIEQGDACVLKEVRQNLEAKKNLILINQTKGKEIMLKNDLSQREIDIILAGGLLNFTKHS